MRGLTLLLIFFLNAFVLHLCLQTHDPAQTGPGPAYARALAPGHLFWLPMSLAGMCFPRVIYGAAHLSAGGRSRRRPFRSSWETVAGMRRRLFMAGTAGSANQCLPGPMRFLALPGILLAICVLVAFSWGRGLVQLDRRADAFQGGVKLCKAGFRALVQSHPPRRSTWEAARALGASDPAGCFLRAHSAKISCSRFVVQAAIGDGGSRACGRRTLSFLGFGSATPQRLSWGLHAE